MRIIIHITHKHTMIYAIPLLTLINSSHGKDVYKLRVRLRCKITQLPERQSYQLPATAADEHIWWMQPLLQ